MREMVNSGIEQICLTSISHLNNFASFYCIVRVLVNINIEHQTRTEYRKMHKT